MLLATLIVPNVYAQETEILDTQRALQLAAQGNLDLRREQIALRIAQSNLMAAEGRFDLTLATDLTFSQRISPSITAMDSGAGTTSALDLDVGLLRQLESGGNITLGMSGVVTYSTIPNVCRTPLDFTSECTFYTGNLSLRFNHPLMRGFGGEFAKADIRRRTIQTNVALLNRQTRVAVILRDVLTSYWELAYAASDLEIRRSAVELAHQQLEVTEAQIEVGRLAPIDRAAVQRAINDRLQDVALAEQTLYFRTLELRRLFGMKGDPGSTRYQAAEVPFAEPAAVDSGFHLKRALENSPQLKSLQQGLELNDIDVFVAQSLLKPQLDVFGQIGSTGSNPRFEDSLAQTLRFDNVVWSTGLSFRMPLQNRAARGQLDASRHAKEQAWVNAEALELDIRDTVLRLGSNIKTASKRVELARAAVKFATQNLEAEEARFAVGRSTNNDVLLRQQELKMAEIQVVRATVDLLNSEIALQAVTGDILENHGVALR